jgi:hypothetical protein
MTIKYWTHVQVVDGAGVEIYGKIWRGNSRKGIKRAVGRRLLELGIAGKPRFSAFVPIHSYGAH